MINQIDKRLKGWIVTVLGNVTVSLDAPIKLSKNQESHVVWLYLMGFAEMTPLHKTKELNWRISLRYLVTASAKSPLETHILLGKLLFAALGSSEFEVEQEPIPISLWSAFGIVPQPAFMLRVPFTTSVLEHKSKPVLNMILNQK